MIICRGCGNENEEGQPFCASCGSFLEFSGEKVEEPKPAPRPRPSPPRPVASAAPSAPSPPAPPMPPAEAKPPAPPEPPRSSKGRLTFSAPRPSQSTPAVPATPAPAATDAPDGPAQAQAQAPAPPATPAPANSSKAPPLAPPAPPVRLPEGAAETAAAPSAANAPAEPDATRVAGAVPGVSKDAAPVTASNDSAPVTASNDSAPVTASNDAAPVTAPTEVKPAVAPAPASNDAAPVTAPTEVKPAVAPAPTEVKPAEVKPAEVKPAEAAPAAAAPGAPKEPDERVRALVTRPTATTPIVVRSGPQPVRPVAGATGAGAMQPRQPDARQPTAQQPAMPKDKPPTVKPPKSKAKQYRPGDLYCGKCGEGNEATRKFCRKCGESLAQAQQIAPLPWYKRLFKREKKVLKAGERSKRHDGSPSGGRRGKLMAKKIFRWVVIITAILFLIAILGPWKEGFRAKQAAVTKKIKGFFVPTYDALHPDSAEATSSLPEHPAALAIDGTTNLAWQEGANGDGEQQKLVLRFNRQVNIDRIGFRIGVSDDQEEFLSQPRPRQVHVQFSNNNGIDLTLKDKPDFQHFSVKGHTVVQVEITIINVNTSYKGGHDMGIAEVELFKKT